MAKKKNFVWLKIILVILLIIVLIAGGYVAYVLMDYHRLDDNLTLDIDGTCNNSEIDVDSNHNILSWNIGFCAYTDQFSFFMDGGKYSRAFSEQAVLDDLNGIFKRIDEIKPEFALIQEVDDNSTRSYHVDEHSLFNEHKFPESYQSTFGINYDSPYLFYPIVSPIGRSHSGVLTMSSYDITGSIRRSLPIQTSLAKLLDLDRCYTINRVPTSDGKELILVNLHLSAYTTDPTIVNQQLSMLFEDLVKEYENGNYVIAGGDFNMDLLGNSAEIFGVSGEDYSWAQPFPVNKIPAGFNLNAPFDSANPYPSCRNADAPWDKETNFQITIDGFITSDNIKVSNIEVLREEFKYSDHNPVRMEFEFISEDN